MPANDYHFITEWHAANSTPQEVFEVLADARTLPIWWPAVYLDVTPVPGRSDAFDLLTKGWLPYTLRWRLIAQGAEAPHTICIGAEGDFVGGGVWTLKSGSKGGTTITFDWKLTAEKPLLRSLSPLLKPLFAANHRWAMATGQVSLLRELTRRRAEAVGDKEETPSPPGPTTWESWAAIIGFIAIFFLIGTAITQHQKHRR